MRPYVDLLTDRGQLAITDHWPMRRSMSTINKYRLPVRYSWRCSVLLSLIENIIERQVQGQKLQWSQYYVLFKIINIFQCVLILLLLDPTSSQIEETNFDFSCHFYGETVWYITTQTQHNYNKKGTVKPWLPVTKFISKVF